MNTETTVPENLTEKDAPELTAEEKLNIVESIFRQYFEAHGVENYVLRVRIAWSLMMDMPFLLAMARRTAEAEEKLKAAEGELARMKDTIKNVAMLGRMIHANSKATDTIKLRAKSICQLSARVAPESVGSILREAGYAGCSCSWIRPLVLLIDPNCPVHGVETE